MTHPSNSHSHSHSLGSHIPRMYNATSLTEYVDNAVHLANAQWRYTLPGSGMDQHGNANPEPIPRDQSMNWFQCRNASHMLAVDHTVIEEWHSFLHSIALT